MVKNRNKARKSKHIRIRKQLLGTKTIPRVNVFKSLKNFEAQLIDDESNKSLAYSSTVHLKIKNGSNIDAAKKVGEDLASKINNLKINKIKFDRSGYIYHGRVKAFAEVLREKGVKF